MKEIIENRILSERNIIIENEAMPNGETRFRVKWQDLSGVNITTSGENPGWQNAHYHKAAKEVYIVQKGKILFAKEDNGKVSFEIHSKGDIIIIEPYVKHNVYMFKDTMTYVIKCGQTEENDWYEAKELDKVSKEYKL